MPHTALLSSVLNAVLSAGVHEVVVKLNVSITKPSTSGQLHEQPIFCNIPFILSGESIISNWNQSAKRILEECVAAAPAGIALDNTGNSLKIADNSVSSRVIAARVHEAEVIPAGVPCAPPANMACWVSCVNIAKVPTRQSSRGCPAIVEAEVVLNCKACWFNAAGTNTQVLDAPAIPWGTVPGGNASEIQSAQG